MADSCRPKASLSLDLDNLWAYLAVRGDPEWRSLPTYLPRLLPRFLDLMDRRSLSMTVFVVGLDAEQDSNSDELMALGESRHEVGNHSHRHDPLLCIEPEEEISRQLGQAHDAIRTATGRVPTGFRSPGFATSPALLRCLGAAGYRYDSSIFPSFMGPLARLYYKLRSGKRLAKGKDPRDTLFGPLSAGLRPLEAFPWNLGDEASPAMTEQPVTTMPWLKLPIHGTYILYLSRFSVTLARTYLRLALDLCARTGVEPCYLLHPLELLGAGEVEGLQFFPAMDLPLDHKTSVLNWLLDELQSRFDVGTLEEQVTRAPTGPARTPAELRV